VPIHDQGYRRYGGERAPQGRSWAVIASAGVRALLARRAFLGLLLVAWVPFLVRAVTMYMAANLPQAQFLAPTSATFRDFLGQQDVFVFFIAVYAGAGLIANDRRANALQIYLSKPLTRGEYVFGKLAILLTFLLLVTWVPASVLLVVQVMFAGSLTFVVENLHLLPAITVASLVQALTVSFAMLALSSLTSSSRYAGVLYAGLVFLSAAIYNVLYAVTRDSSWAWLSMSNNFAQVAAAVFRVTPAYDTPWLLSLGVAAAVVAGSALVLARRVRAVEIVA
jgi:ABC-2 type transport system permease protein